MEAKFYKAKSEYLWQIVLIIAGICCLIASFLIKDTDKIFATVNGVGVSLLLSGLVGLFISITAFRKETKYKVCEEWGIKNIYETRAIANSTIDVYQERAKEKIDIVAFGLNSWRQAKEKLIDSMLAQGVEIRIITVDPEDATLIIRDKAEEKAQGATRESIIQLRKFFEKTDLRRRVKIKYHKELPLDFYFRVDDHVFVGPYLYGKDSQQTITYEFEKGGEGFDYYVDYFDKIWQKL